MTPAANVKGGAAVLPLDVHRARLDLAAAAARLSVASSDPGSSPAAVSRALREVNVAAGRLAVTALLAPH